MSERTWSRRVHIAGVILMFAGLVDPLEGSVVIALGSLLVALSANLARSAFRRWAYGGLAVLLLGVGAMFALSAFGGVGGPGGLSWWWALPVVLYPAGWVLTLVAVLRMRAERMAPQPPASQAPA